MKSALRKVERNVVKRKVRMKGARARAKVSLVELRLVAVGGTLTRQQRLTRARLGARRHLWLGLRVRAVAVAAAKVRLEDLDAVERDDGLVRGHGEVGEAGDARGGTGVVGHVARARRVGDRRRMRHRLRPEEPAAAHRRR